MALIWMALAAVTCLAAQLKSFAPTINKKNYTAAAAAADDDDDKSNTKNHMEQ